MEEICCRSPLWTNLSSLSSNFIGLDWCISGWQGNSVFLQLIVGQYKTFAQQLSCYHWSNVTSSAATQISSMDPCEPIDRDFQCTSTVSTRVSISSSPHKWWTSATSSAVTPMGSNIIPVCGQGNSDVISEWLGAIVILTPYWLLITSWSHCVWLMPSLSAWLWWYNFSKFRRWVTLEQGSKLGLCLHSQWMPHCALSGCPFSMPWLQLRLHGHLLCLPKLLLMPKEPNCRLHLDLETLKFFNPSHLLRFCPKPMHLIDCIESYISWACVNREAHIVFHPFSDIGILANIQCPKPRQGLIPLST